MTATSTDLARMSTTAAIDVLREQIAPGASNDELAYFAQVCTRLDLSPFADQIVLVGRYDKRVGRNVFRHQVTVAGRRALAERTGELQGIEGPEWAGPRVRGELVWREVWDEDDPPYVARVFVHRKGWVKPANGTCKWSEWIPKARDGSILGLWVKMPSHMLGKSAESLALKRAFPDVIPADVGAGFDPDLEPDIVELVHVDNTGEPPEEPVAVRGSAAPAPPDPVAALPAADQAEAHRVVGGWDTDVKEAWMRNWDIETFGEAWPAEAVADALSQPF